MLTIAANIMKSHGQNLVTVILLKFEEHRDEKAVRFAFTELKYLLQIAKPMVQDSQMKRLKTNPWVLKL